MPLSGSSFRLVKEGTERINSVRTKTREQRRDAGFKGRNWIRKPDSSKGRAYTGLSLYYTADTVANLSYPASPSFFFVTCFCPGQARECAKIAAKAGEIDKLFLHVQVIFLRSKFVCEFTHFRNLLNRVKKL